MIVKLSAFFQHDDFVGIFFVAAVGIAYLWQLAGRAPKAVHDTTSDGGTTKQGN